ncbi:MAG TPA: ATP-dependent helicase [Gemmatimonadales bacterium]|nr:ATP-dependent helicase [Gemmatimonadales bacterium]
MAWSDDLEGVHRDIAADPKAPVHVLAGPGTGKTFAMMRRIARLLEAGVPPDRILAVSFTRTAAHDLQAQLVNLNAPGAIKVNATTLHALCFRVLAEETVFAITGRTARPLMSYEIEQMVNDLAAAFGGKKAVRQLREAYEAAWARMQHEDPGSPRSSEDQKFEAALLEWLHYHRAMLIGELVPVALNFINQNPGHEVLPPYDAVLADEYQDLNRADQALVESLAEKGELTVIGDDNQSIYSFRHAHPEGIRVFPTEHPGTVEYVIDECRQCPPNVVAMSNALLAHDPAARPAPLSSMPGRAPARVIILQHASVEEEADVVAAFIDRYLSDQPDLPPGQVLVLSPRRLMGNAVKDALIRRRRNALSYFWEDAVDSDAAAEGLCLLTLAVEGTDRAAYRAWLGIGHDKGHAPAYARIRARAEADGVEPRAIVEQLVAGTLKVNHTGGLATRHQALIARGATLGALEGLALVDALWPPGDEDTQTIRLAAQNLAVQHAKPADLLRELREVITQPELPSPEGDVIRVMSLHKSKGLTAALVVVVGCVSGAIPTVDPSLPKAEHDATWRE